MAYWSDPQDVELAALTRFADGFAGKRVLEVGCGRGRLTRRFAPEAAFIDAIDPNEEKIAAAREAGVPANVTYHELALEEFRASAPYDLVLLSWSL
jgi:2-polyprenyl-3-methyl-5-hydroxy-6-metoxy-1,4-benzoquinol methylase